MGKRKKAETTWKNLGVQRNFTVLGRGAESRDGFCCIMFCFNVRLYICIFEIMKSVGIQESGKDAGEMVDK